MKKRIEIIGTIATVGIMLVCALGMGSVTSNHTVDAQTKIESKELIPKEEICPEKRIMFGYYYDYMVVETVDGNEWLLDDTKDSPYILNDVAVFEDGELVQVVFDTMGTESVMDDVIVEVRRIDETYK